MMGKFVLAILAITCFHSLSAMLSPDDEFEACDGKGERSALLQQIKRPSVFLTRDKLPTPSLTLMARVYAGAKHELLSDLLPSYQIFWPQQGSWPNSRLVLIWDAESDADHAAASDMPTFVYNVFEKMPASGTLCDKMKSIGYAGQQYSNFVIDQVLGNVLRDNNEYVGILDSDAYFITAAIPEELFDWDASQSRWRPRVFGYNSCCLGWSSTTERVLGHKQVAGQFMIVLGFPIIIKVDHLKYIRDVIAHESEFNTSSFEESFRTICDTGSFSQLDIMMNILWASHFREEYSWYLRDQNDAHHPAFQKRVTSDEAVLSKNDYNAPKIGLMKHAGHRLIDKMEIKKYVCTYDRLTASEQTFCDGLSTEQRAALNRERFVDWTGGGGEQAPGDSSISQSMQQHMDRVNLAREEFSWLAA